MCDVCVFFFNQTWGLKFLTSCRTVSFFWTCCGGACVFLQRLRGGRAFRSCLYCRLWYKFQLCSRQYQQLSVAAARQGVLTWTWIVMNNYFRGGTSVPWKRREKCEMTALPAKKKTYTGCFGFSFLKRILCRKTYCQICIFLSFRNI